MIGNWIPTGLDIHIPRYMHVYMYIYYCGVYNLYIQILKSIHVRDGFFFADTLL